MQTEPVGKLFESEDSRIRLLLHARIVSVLTQNKIDLDRRLMELRRLDNLKIVVVDDQEKVRSSVGHFLADKGAQVEACQNVDEALEAVPKVHPDLIISDIRMPEKDGFELLHAVRLLDDESTRKVPVIAMTAYEAETDEAITRPPMFDGFLPKPFTPTALMQVISDVLTRTSPKAIREFISRHKGERPAEK